MTLNIDTARIKTDVFFNNGYKISITVWGFVFIGLLTADFARVHQIEVYEVQDGLEIFQGYARQGGELFGRLCAPLLSAAKQNRAATL